MYMLIIKLRDTALICKMITKDKWGIKNETSHHPAWGSGLQE